MEMQMHAWGRGVLRVHAPARPAETFAKELAANGILLAPERPVVVSGAEEAGAAAAQVSPQNAPTTFAVHAAQGRIPKHGAWQNNPGFVLGQCVHAR